jgi:hypothetical protein
MGTRFVFLPAAVCTMYKVFKKGYCLELRVTATEFSQQPLNVFILNNAGRFSRNLRKYCDVYVLLV